MEIVTMLITHISECVFQIAVKNFAAKAADLISWKNGAKQIKWNESCKCECRLDPIICNNNQKWNINRCRCECLVNKTCDNNFVWNPRNCKCEYKIKAAIY